MDSMVFEPSSRTIHYYYSLVGNADNEQAVNAKKSELRKALRDALKADTGTKGYKDAGFNFRYTYRSGKLLQRCCWMSNTLKRTIKKLKKRILERVSEVRYDSNLSVTEN